MTEEGAINALGTFLEERILVLNGRGSHLGGCFLELSNKCLFIVKDQIVSASTTGQEVADLLLTALQPTKVLVSARLNEAAHDCLSNKAALMNYTFDILSTKAFSADCSNYVLEDLTSEQRAPVRLFPLLSEIRYDKQSLLAKNSLHALKISVESIDTDDNESLEFRDYVQDIQIFVPADYMYIERDTFYDLQIFNSQKLIKTEKASVFDLLNHTGSLMGSKTLNSWFYSPLTNVQKINERLNVIETLACPDNGRCFDDIIRLMKNLPSINQTLPSLKSGNPRLPLWCNLLTFIKNAIHILTSVSQISTSFHIPFFDKILQEIDTHTLSKILQRIENTIDFESSKDWKRVYVKDGYNQELDMFKIRYNELENMLRDLAYELSQNYRQFPEESLNVVYIPQLGYLISLETEVGSQGNIPENWGEIFRTITNVYFKNDVTEKMDEEYGDVYQMIIDLEIEILYDLQTRVFEYQKSLLKLGFLFGQLDAFCALASSSLLLDLTKPQFVEDPVLIVEDGRNIVIESQSESYIPNNINLENAKVTIITGANASGKSVYLSQIGIIAFLAHIGSFVPAKICSLGVIDKILTKTVSNESIERNQSFFYKDLLKIAKSMDMKTERSLLLIDEFGKGTDSIGGPSLLGSIIEKLSSSEIGSRSVVTTHFHELFKENVLNSEGRIVHFHMDVLITDVVEKLIYLYKLKPGLAENSFGIQCADICGIPKAIIERAYQIMKFEESLQNEESTNEQVFVQAKQITKNFLLWDLDKESLSPQQVKSTLGEILSQKSTI